MNTWVMMSNDVYMWWNQLCILVMTYFRFQVHKRQVKRLKFFKCLKRFISSTFFIDQIFQQNVCTKFLLSHSENDFVWVWKITTHGTVTACHWGHLLNQSYSARAFLASLIRILLGRGTVTARSRHGTSVPQLFHSRTKLYPYFSHSLPIA
jgi:hypothetical protein